MHTCNAETTESLICIRRQLLRLRLLLRRCTTLIRKADKRTHLLILFSAACFVLYIIMMPSYSRFPRYRHVPPRQWLPRHPPASICGMRSENFSTYFQLPLEARSLNNEDLDLFHKLFYHTATANGTYVELGAFNGKHESNTRFFDLCLGWEGILIEANPLQYRRLVRNRPNAHRLSFSPTCSNEGTAIFQTGRETMSGLQGVISSVSEKPTNVPCGNLTPVLTELLNGHVSLFVLDVEGAEPLVLKHLDWSEVFIEVFVVESWSANCLKEPEACKSRDEVRQILEMQQGYRRYSRPIYKSDLYIHPESSLVLLDTSDSKGRPTS